MSQPQQASSSTGSSKIFNNQFVVIKKLSSGSFGVVFLGHDNTTNQDVAIKVEKEENEEVRSLEREVAVLKKLADTEGVPKLFWAGEEQDYNIIVLQLLGKDLAFYMKNYKKFSIKTVLLIGMQLVPTLERIHIKGVIHRDLKPENIMFGKDGEIGKIYLVDYGISKIYRDSNNKHMYFKRIENYLKLYRSFKENKPFIGTTRYASLAAHKGYELGRKDDLESMMYVLLFFIKGILPWQNMQNITDEERTKAVGEMKQKIDLNELCKDLPQEFIKIFDYLKQLNFKTDPDYKYVTGCFEKAALSLQIELDGVYDWTDTSQFKKVSTMETSKHDFQKQQSQQLAPPPPVSPLEKNGKQIQRQLSNQMMGSSSNFLVPPDPFKLQQSQGLNRQDSRQHTNTSMQGSMQMSTYNSMMPKYQPSMAGSEDDQLQNQNSNNNIQDTKQQQALNKGNLVQMKQSHPSGQQPTDTLGAKECDLDENYEEEPLALKYSHLKKKQVKTQVNQNTYLVDVLKNLE